MKILYVLGPVFPGGATISFKIILDGILKNGHEAIVLVTKEASIDEPMIQYMHKKGCIVERFLPEMFVFPKVNLIKWQDNILKFPWRFIRMLINIYQSNKRVLYLAKKYQPHLIHTNIGVFRQGFYAAKKMRIPHLWHVREYQTKDFGWHILPSKKYYEQLLRKSFVICITKEVLNYFKQNNNSQAITLWDGILSKRDLCFYPQKDNFFLCANRVSPEKGLEDAIRAFSSASKRLPAHNLLIVGTVQSNEYLKKLKLLIHSLGLTNRVEIKDHVENVTELMARATALLVTSIFEGLGRMSLEATFKGCLVLGRNAGGTKEIIESTNGGFLFNNVNELSSLMVKTAHLSNSEAYTDIIYRAQKVVLARCSNENYCDKIKDIYNNIILHDRL